MSDPTIEVLRQTMQAIVAAAPEAPDLKPVAEPKTVRRTRPVLVMASAFAFVLLVGAMTSLVLIGYDRGPVPIPSGGTEATTSMLVSVPIVYDPLPANWDAIAVIDAGSLERDPDEIGRFVEEAGAVLGVESISVVSPEDLAMALGWEDGSGGGVFIVTGGDASVAEQVALLAPDGWKIVLSARAAQQVAEQAVEQLRRYSDPITDQLSLGAFSGSDPAFDPATLGDEMPLENAYDGASELPRVPEVFGELSDTIIYIGSIDGVDGFVYGVDIDGGATEVCQSATWTASVATATACFTLGEPGLSKMVGMAESASDGIVAALTALDSDVSVVAIGLPSSQQYWQRPVAGSVMFVTDDPGVLVGITITTYDAFGSVITTERYNPNS